MPKEKPEVIEKPKEPEVEIKEEKIDGDIGNIVVEKDDEGKEDLFVIEEADKEPAEPDKKEESKKEDLDKPEKPDKDSSDDKFEITDDHRMLMLEKKMEKMGKDFKEATLTEDQLRRRVPVSEMKAKIKAERDKLSYIDKEAEPDDWERQNRIVTTLDGDIMDKERTARAETEFNSKANKDFLKDERKLLADKGHVFTNAQFDGLEAAAEQYLEKGRYTSEGFRKGIVDILGAEVSDKMYEVGAEIKARKEIKEAAKKVTKSVRITSKGVSAKLVSLMDKLDKLEPDQYEAALDKLSPEQYAIYKKNKDRKK